MNYDRVFRRRFYQNLHAFQPTIVFSLILFENFIPVIFCIHLTPIMSDITTCIRCAAQLYILL